jgi:hypothetical protein
MLPPLPRLSLDMAAAPASRNLWSLALAIILSIYTGMNPDFHVSLVIFAK